MTANTSQSDATATANIAKTTVPPLRLPQVLLDDLRAHGEETWPRECCGALLGKFGPEGWRIETLVRATNARADSAHDRYEIAPAELVEIAQEARRRGLEIVGFYHSHPDHPARPSQYDLDHAVWPWWSYIIVSIQKGTPALLTSWALAEDRSKFEEETVEICQPKS